MMTNSTLAKVTSGVVITIGDIHLSDKFQGQHISYIDNCRRVMARILEMAHSHKDVSVIFLGDLFGVSERRFTTREFLKEVMDFFEELNSHTHKRVFSVKGNHDISHHGMSDFDFFVSLGLLQTPATIDYTPGDAGIRFHLISYGQERRELPFSDTLVNVGLAHNDFGLPGVASSGWFHGDKAFDLESLTNFNRLRMLLSGHIHTPSPEPAYVNYEVDGDTNECLLYYPGCPTRVSERFDDCNAIVFSLDNGSVSFDTMSFNLIPVSEEFHDKVEEDLTAKGIDDDTQEALMEIVGNLQSNTGLLEGNIISIIQSRIDIPESVKTLALSFLEKELNRAR